MITKLEFFKIRAEIQNSLRTAFDLAKRKSSDSDYILFLANAQFVEEKPSQWSPYSLDNREDMLEDDSRYDFFLQFMRVFYSFPKWRPRVKDDKLRMNLELMIYSHLWESKSFLKQLSRLAKLTNQKGYDWYAKIPEMTKWKFILSIRDTFELEGLSLSNVIKNGFHTSLRNAFAHSQYSINMEAKLVHLYTFKGDASWDIPHISFDEWSKRFVYSTILSYELTAFWMDRRRKIVDDFGTNKFEIIFPISKSKSAVRKISYNEAHDMFSFS